MVSVIIPAYKATKYIDECLASIKGDCEILIGVDACEETYNHIKRLDNVFYFTRNVGPYVIKNTLIDVAKYDNILFFDADDVMAEGLVKRFNEAIQNVDYVKLNYVNFTDKIKTSGQTRNDAVIGIKKSVINSLNGFYPWKCAADTELENRLKHHNFKSKVLEGVSYYRRLHGDNLTMREDTGYTSAIRNEYINLIARNKRTGYPNPQIKTIYTYVKD